MQLVLQMYYWWYETMQLVLQPQVLGDIQLLDGEKVMSVARDVTYLCPYSGPSRGVLKVTNYQLHFRPTESSALQGTLSVPLGVVSICFSF